MMSGSPLEAQNLITAAEVMAMETPPPTHRVAYGPDPLQFGHLRLPGGEGPFPVVLFVHGGCWLSEYGIGHTGSLEAAWAEAGYAVWSVEYRRVGDPAGGWPNTFLDVAAGGDHLRTLARDFPLDLDRVVAAGHSAGGSFALWLASRAHVPRESPLWSPNPLPIHGFLGLAPAADLERLHQVGICGNVIQQLLGGSPDEAPDRYAAVSPMRLPPLSVPQVVVLGEHDDTWTPIAEAWLDRVREERAEVAVEVVRAAESGHFEMIVPGTSTWPLVMGALEAVFQAVGPEGLKPQPLGDE